MLNVDKNALINNLCQKSGLEGAALSEYKARLSKMSAAELTALISGNNTDNNTDTVEFNNTNTTNTPIDKSTAQDLSIENIESNANQALEMVSKQDDGVISKTYNDLKEKFYLGLPKSKVEEVIYKQFKTAEYLKKAKANNLTYAEYFDLKRGFLMGIFPGVENLDDKQKEMLKNMISSLSMDELLEQQDKILNLPDKDSPEYQEAKNKFFSEFKDKTTDTIATFEKNDFSQKMKVKTKPKAEYKPENGDRLMTFDEVYMLEQGVEFNKDNIQKSNESAATFTLINNVKAKKDKVHEILHDNLRLVEGNYDLDALITKAQVEVKAQNVKPAEVPTFKLRSLDSIVGVEKIVLNKFKNEIDQNIWGNPERFKAWAKEKVEKIIDFENNPNYIATGDYASYNTARKEGIANWYNYLTKESNYKDDVFVHLLVMDGITKEMRPNNAVTPPAITHESFEATYNALLEQNSSVSFSKIYAQQTKQNAINKYTTQEVSLDGVEGRWVTIPRSQKGEPNYDEHIAMVQALSEGSSWCLRFENAHGYLQGGNLHFFVDKNGNSQVAINETDGTITQIQKRYNQDSTVPIPYAQVIANWAKDNNYKGHENQIQTALNAKPEFDNLKKQIAELQKNKDSLGIFKLMNIKVKNAEDGTYIISYYKAKYNNQYTLFDLGVDENELMKNVSEISSSLDLEGSSLTSLPKLRKIKGKINLGDNKLNDFRSLESINGKKVYWE